MKGGPVGGRGLWWLGDRKRIPTPHSTSLDERKCHLHYPESTGQRKTWVPQCASNVLPLSLFHQWEKKGLTCHPSQRVSGLQMAGKERGVASLSLWDLDPRLLGGTMVRS